MQLYYEIALRSLRRATTYRLAFFGGIVTNAFFGALVCYVYQALYGVGGSVAGLSLNDAISYSWATQALISVGAGWVSSHEISASIRTGDVVTDLMRLWSFYLYWLSRSLGERVFNLLARGSLTYLVGVILFGARVPSGGDLLAFGPAIMFALLISFAFTFCINLTAFWLLDNLGVILLANVALSFFSGFLVPIAFFPPLLQTITRALPFQAITGLPAQIFLGQINQADLLTTFALQLFWLLVLTALALLMQAAALRKVVVQGG
ncbi:MAG: ABC transporter permease [Oscillochloridaceae bacterium umkhey_bin13]